MDKTIEPCTKKIKLDDSCGEPGIVVSDLEEYSDNGILNEKEEKYGLTSFIDRTLRFSGIIKQRYSDFMVRECDLEGNLVYLTNLDHCDANLEEDKSKSAECPINDKELLKKIEEFVGSEDKSSTFTLNADNDKDHRKLVHKYIKDTFDDIETDTAVLEDGSRAITLSFKSNKSKERRPGWPRSLPNYCHFVMFKENRNTMECVSLLSKMLHLKPGKLGYSGTKDQRSTSIQRVSVEKVYSKNLKNLNSRLKNIVLGNFSYKSHPLKLGDLSGNSFTIIVRDVSAPDAQIDSCCSKIKEKGFINYYGLQRFGTGAVPTHIIGLSLVKSNVEEAVNLILQDGQSVKNRRYNSAAKEIWQKTKDARKALSAIQSKSSIEGRLLEHLAKQQNDNYNFYNAFMVLPRNNRLMYLHAYQSIVWNNMVSKRIEEYGLEPVIGDLVLNKEKDEKGHPTVSILTDIDIELKTFNIYDIVLPLPGYDMVYPLNKMKTYYKEYLESDGVDIDSMRNKVKDLSLAGAYRNILVKPQDMKWEIIRYDDYTISLIENDYQKLMARQVDGKKNLSRVDCNHGGKHKALKLECILGTSCYATTALRELLTSDCSYKTQTTLNEQFKLKDIKS